MKLLIFFLCTVYNLFYFHGFICTLAFNALMLLVGQQEEHLAHKKLEWWGAGVVICLEWLAYGPVDATATPLSLLHKNPEWFIFLVWPYLCCPRKKATKWMLFLLLCSYHAKYKTCFASICFCEQLNLFCGKLLTVLTVWTIIKVMDFVLWLFSNAVHCCL